MPHIHLREITPFQPLIVIVNNCGLHHPVDIVSCSDNTASDFALEEPPVLVCGLERGAHIELLFLAIKNTGYPVKFEFQTHNEYVLV